ncbi:MAG: acyl-CoA-binding protein [Acidimicrobiia bacterium]|nr:acyl-CoA-binding protein [Acidimicrobiia bacterium]
MSDVETAFAAALEEVENLPERPDNQDLLRLYALYKQATLGDVAGKRPGMMDFVKRAKYDAWAELEGTSQEEAMQSYVDVVEELKAAQG